MKEPVWGKILSGWEASQVARMLHPVVGSEKEASRGSLANTAALWHAYLQIWSTQEEYHRSRSLPWQAAELVSGIPRT